MSLEIRYSYNVLTKIPIPVFELLILHIMNASISFQRKLDIAIADLE